MQEGRFHVSSCDAQKEVVLGMNLFIFTWLLSKMILYSKPRYAEYLFIYSLSQIKYNLKRVCNTKPCFLSSFSCSKTYLIIAHIQCDQLCMWTKTQVYSIVFINIITNKSHLQSEDILEFKSRRLSFADVIKM